MNIEDFICNPHPFLAGMTAAHLRLISEDATESHFAAGDVIFREGDVANRFYLVQRGEVALQTFSAGQPTSVQLLGAGEALGWSWLFPPHHWHFGAVALKDTDAICIYAPRLREKSEADPALGYELMSRVAKIVIARLQATRLRLVHAQKPNPQAASRLAVPVGA